jgi:alkaline phosphatase
VIDIFGLTVDTVTEAYSSTVLADQIAIQIPAAGTLVARESSVSLVLSLGPEPVAVPHVVDLTQSEAQSSITGLGLSLGELTEIYHDTLPETTVITQDPIEGVLLLPGDPVDLVVSLGPEPLPADLSVDIQSLGLRLVSRSATVTVTNLGEVDLSWTATSSDATLTISPDLFTGTSREVTIATDDFNTTRTAQVTFTNDADPADREVVEVTVTGRGDEPCPQAGLVKHIILFIGDGMHLQHEIAASRYLFGMDQGLSFHQLPYQTPVTTWDANSYNRYAWLYNTIPYSHDDFEPTIGYDPAYGGAAPYPMDTVIADGYFLNFLSTWGDDTHDVSFARQPAPDSASTATAMSTGQKTNIGNIAWAKGDFPDGALPTLGEQMREATGALFGVASTVPYIDATLASFAAHGPDRKEFIVLSESMLRDVQPDFIIGGGHPDYFGTPPNFKFIAEETYNDVQSGALEYLFVGRETGVSGAQVLSEGFDSAIADGKKLFALFGNNVGFLDESEVIDAPDAPEIIRGTEESPMLNEITDLTLNYLRTQAGDKGFMAMFEQGDVDKNNHRNDFKSMVGAVRGLHLAVQTAVDFVDEPDDAITWENTLLLVTADHSHSYMRLTDNPVLGPGDLPEQVVLADPGDDPIDEEEKAWESPFFAYPGGEVVYHSRAHTNEPVMLYARGDAVCLFSAYEGLWYPGTRLIDNTHIYKVCAEAVGLAK